MEEVADFMKGPQWEADNKTIEQAKEILRRRICPKEDVFVKSRAELHDYLKMRVGGLEHEAFGVVFFGIRGEVIDCQEMFRGTLTEVPTYTREIAKAVLRNNASAVVVYHNHPSASIEPSQGDINVTVHVHRAMAMIGVELLDHIVVAGDRIASIADLGHMPSKRKFSDIPPQVLALLELMGVDPSKI